MLKRPSSKASANDHSRYKGMVGMIPTARNIQPNPQRAKTRFIPSEGLPIPIPPFRGVIKA
ncbi:MAG: hypothetical protein ABI684_10835, partial [Nitrospirota bacterium]